MPGPSPNSAENIGKPPSTSQTFVPHLDMSKGMVFTGAPHRQPEATWLDANGFRFQNGSVYQFPLCKRYLPTVGSNFSGVYPSIGLIPNGTSGQKLIEVTAAWNSPGTDNVVNFNPATGYSQVIGTLNSSLEPYYSVVLGADGALYITNLANTLKRCDGSAIVEWIVASPNDPNTLANNPMLEPYQVDTDTTWRWAARYAEEFYSHLVVANTWRAVDGFTPMRVAYSDIDDFSDFTPLDTNDADFFDLDQAGGLSSYGITGLRRLGEVCAIYTTQEIWNMSYVGFANGVMSFTRQITGIGCAYPNSVVSINRLHYFIGADDFYTYDGYFVRSIGQPIKKFFFDNVSRLLLALPLVRGFAVPDQSEIWWVFPNNAADSTYPTSFGSFPRFTLVYNYKDQTWMRHDYLQGPQVSKTMFFDSVPIGSTWFRSIVSYTGTTISGLTGTQIQALSEYSSVQAQSYVVRGGYLVTEQAGGGASAGDSTIEVPCNELKLVTGDYTYGDQQAVKQINSMLIDGAQLAVGSAAVGVAVQVSARNYISDPVVFVNVGTYTFGTSDRFQFNTTISGRIFRFKFLWLGQTLGPFGETGVSGLFFQQGADTYGCAFNSFGETVYNVQQTK